MEKFITQISYVIFLGIGIQFCKEGMIQFEVAGFGGAILCQLFLIRINLEKKDMVKS